MNQENRFSINEKVKFVDFGQSSIILDIKSGNYYGLNEEMTYYWKLMIKVFQSHEVVNELILSNSIDKDFIALVLDKEFIVLNKKSEIPSENTLSHYLTRIFLLRKFFKLNLTITAFLILRLVKKALANDLFEGVYAMTVLSKIGTTADITVEKAMKAFIRAENFIRLENTPDDCLPRSLSVYYFLIFLGYLPVHYIGVINSPGVSMHAWTQIDEKIMFRGSHPENLYDYKIMSELHATDKLK